MALDQMTALEARVRTLVDLAQHNKGRISQLEQELRGAKDRLGKQAELNRQWEEERTDIRLRIEKVLGELEFFECLEDPRRSKEVALD